MHTINKGLMVLAGLLIMTACGGDKQASELHPLRTVSITAADLTKELKKSADGLALLALAGEPKCGVDVHYLHYSTRGGAQEATNATAALMIPTGTRALCIGPRPRILYAHGTSAQKRFNLADGANLSVARLNPAAEEAASIAALYAAQGYIVVAPNYAGYDTSTLSYHPFLNAQQQSTDMIDALESARMALPKTPAGAKTQASDKLFVAGYSEGGHVALATARALEAKNIAVTGSAALSGPYAMAAFGDAVFSGTTNVGSTLFAPLLVNSYQHAYKTIYASPSDVFTPKYLAGIDTLLPGSMAYGDLLMTGKLPSALFQSGPTGITHLEAISPPSPLFAHGFNHSDYLINTVYRAGFLQDALANPDGAASESSTNPVPAANPQHPLRKALKTNDLRGYTPASPTFLCGGNSDPVVFFKNTQLISTIWQAQAAQASAIKYAILDMDTSSILTSNSMLAGQLVSHGLSDNQSSLLKTVAGQYQAGFTEAKESLAKTAINEGATDEGLQAILMNYHTLVAPFCGAVARAFFDTL